MDELFSIANFSILFYGFLIGLKHATDTDHLAAIGTIIAEKRSLLSSALVGGLWGLGHTVSLSLAGFLILFLEFQISEEVEKFFESCVAVMLLLLGLNVFRKLLQGGELHFHTHSHGSITHAHPHIHLGEDAAHTHHGLDLTFRSFLIGLVHGLAGSAGLMLMVIPTINSKLLGIVYIIVFGIGSIGGMMIMSFLVGLPFFLSSGFIRLNKILQVLAGSFSLFVGVYIIYEIYFT